MASGGPASPQDTGKARSRPLLDLARWPVTLLDWSGRGIVVGTLAFLFVALLLNVVLRYVFGSGIPWAYEIHSLLLPWLVAGGIVIASARGRNIAVTLLPELLAPRGRRVLAAVIHLTILVITLSVLWSSQPILKASQFQTLSTLGIRQVWGYASLVYAFGGMAVIAACDLIRVLGGDYHPDAVLEHSSLS